MNIAYVRAIVKNKNIGSQLESFKNYAIDRIRIYEEKACDAANQPAWKKMLNDLREGDTIYIESFLTLAHSTFELLEIIAALNKKKVGFVSIKEQIDTTSPAGKLQLDVFLVLYQFERECLKECQCEDKELSITNHRSLGRPKQYSIDENFVSAYHEWKAGNITAVKAMELANMKKVTFYKLVKQYEVQQAGM